MKLYVCSVYDKAASCYMRPGMYRTKGEATRDFMDTCAGDNPMRKHPEDFFFAFLGYYDDHTGMFENNPHGPERLMEALDCRQIEGTVN